jgi:hypothetical protein
MILASSVRRRRAAGRGPGAARRASGQEAAQADVDDEAALDDLDDRAGDDALGLLDLLDRAPGPLVLGPLLGQDEAALLVLLLRTRASICRRG